MQMVLKIASNRPALLYIGFRICQANGRTPGYPERSSLHGTYYSRIVVSKIYICHLSAKVTMLVRAVSSSGFRLKKN